jgi:hypothetical protein
MTQSGPPRRTLATTPRWGRSTRSLAGFGLLRRVMGTATAP